MCVYACVCVCMPPLVCVSMCVMQLVSCDMNCSLLLSFSAQGVCSLYLNFVQHTKHCFFMLEVHAFVNLC